MDGTTIFVGNLEHTQDVGSLEADLFELCTQCGTVNSIRVPGEGTRSKGFAFVEMGDSAGVLYASLALNGLVLYGRVLRVADARSDEARISHRFDNIDPSLDETDVYQRLSTVTQGIRAVSIRRRGSGVSEGKCTVWFDTVDRKEAFVLNLYRHEGILQ